MSVAEMPKTEEPASTRPNDDGLLLDSLEIKNFRAFRHLTIEKLGRVNLITGKNNVGKSALLEALLLLAERGSPHGLYQLLSFRDGLLRRQLRRTENPNGSRLTREPLSDHRMISSVLSLFHGESAVFDGKGFIDIGFGASHLRIKQAWYARNEDTPGRTSDVKQVPFDEIDLHDAHPYLVIEENKRRLRRYGLQRIFDSAVPLSPSLSAIPPRPCEAVWTNWKDNSNLVRLWDQVVRDGEGEGVVSALRTIIPDIVKVDFLSDESLRRKPYVFCKGYTKPIPLAHFGDGVNRLLHIATALVSASGGFLIVDEIENGIHYTILPAMWVFITTVAREFDVQVFATTHSWGCIEAFQQAAAEDGASDGVLVRLQREGDNVTSTVFDERRLEIMTRRGLEVR